MFGYRHIRWAVAAVAALLMACSPRGLREAQSVVTQADSLWQAGLMYDDSLRLAEAYRTLGDWQWIFPDEFAHSGYHYGRLLRTRDNPVEAMQCFISATHSRTRDYHILGRVYSNMGDLCHLAGEYPLSYEIFERSAEMFERTGDTTNYFYATYRKAYELAEQGKKDSCYDVIKDIKCQCLNDSLLIAYCYMSQAQACFRCQLYDSLIIYAHLSKCYFPAAVTSIMQLAQAYSLLGYKDSATYYAQQVIATSKSLSDLNNALYILTNDDETKNNTDIRLVAAERADTHKLIAIRQGKLSQAVQLLRQDMHKTPDFRWLYAILVTIFIISLIIGVYRQSQKKKHTLLSQQMDDLKNKTIETQKQHLQILHEHQSFTDSKQTIIENTCIIFRQSDNLQEDLQWQDYNCLCDIINKNFYMLAGKLKATNLLNEREIRLCILVLIGGFNGKQLAEWLYYAESGIRNLKNHTARKLGTNSIQLRDFLIELAIDGCVKK